MAKRGGDNQYLWRIPCEVIAALIREWSARNGYQLGKAHTWDPDKHQVGALAMLAKRSGIPIRRISGIMNGTLPTHRRRNGVRVYAYADEIGFDTADRLVIAMEMVDEWHFGRLAEYYQQPIEIAKYERGRSDSLEFALAAA